MATAILFCLTSSVSFGQGVPPINDAPFYQDYHAAYPLSTAAENDVRAIALDAQERVWVATGEGVRYLEKGQWKTPPNGATLGPTYALYRDGQGQLWVGAWNGLYRVTTEQVSPAGLEGTLISSLRGQRLGNSTEETLFAAGPHGLWRKDNNTWKPIPGRWQTAVRAILPTADNQIWIGTGSGLYLQSLTKPQPIATRFSRPNVVLSSSIYSFASLPDGTFCVGSTGGIDFYQGTKRLRSLSTPQGMPNRHARAIARDGEGRLWVATKLGVARYDKGRWSLRHSRRWLLNDDARDVAIGADGTAWVATAGGVDAIRHKKMTLEEKAAYYLTMLRTRHIRPPGFVGPAVLEKPGDLSRSFIEDDDNDGEHTAEYCALESFRYAVTKAPDARENAKAAFHALMALQQVTGTNHFFARSILPISTPPRHEVDRTFTPQEIAETARTDPREKIIEKRWVLSQDGKFLWKRDTSSDEVDGHLFGYSTYYDLAADESEKRLIAGQVDKIIGGIVDHGYVLQDIDGKATRWANWSPESLNGDPNWHEERAGNSVEMIAFLGVAYHVTGKARYQEAAKFLIEKHGYAHNMLQTIFDTPSERTHIEDELLSTVYPNLFNHLIFPSLKSVALTSIRNWYKAVPLDGIPLYDFVYNRFSGKQVSLAPAIETLRDWPLDMIEWTVDSRQREDVVWDRTPGMEEGHLTRILPRSEMGLCMFDQEPYKAVIGLDGQREDKPSDWLLAYWMGRYYGFIAQSN